MARCSFCNKELEKGTGVLYAQKDGKILWFDRTKCEKNMLKLKRKYNSMKWSKR